MKTSHPQAILLAVLIGIMVLVYTRSWRAGSRSGSAQDQAQSELSDASAEARADTSRADDAPALLVREWIPVRQEQRVYVERLGWRRDPFIHGAEANVITGLHLSGILWDPQQPVAIVNGQPRQVGEECEGYRITEILPDRVLVTDGTDTFHLRLSP